MNDNFQQEIEKVNRIERLLKADITSREDLSKKNESTAIVILNTIKYKLNIYHHQ